MRCTGLGIKMKCNFSSVSQSWLFCLRGLWSSISVCQISPQVRKALKSYLLHLKYVNLQTDVQFRVTGADTLEDRKEPQGSFVTDEFGFETGQRLWRSSGDSMVSGASNSPTVYSPVTHSHKHTRRCGAVGKQSTEYQV